jgi:chemotaxis-related protein WspD
MTDALALPVVDCWNDIGVNGDRSCPKLKAAIHCQNCDVFADAARTFLDRPAPAGYLGEVTESLTLPDEQRVAGTISALVFGIGDQLFGIDTTAVVEVTSPRVAHRVGHRSGRIFAGIVNIHGQLELCCSLAGLLQIDGSAESPGGAGARMLLVELDGLRWSFEVSIVHGVQRFEATDVAPVPAASQHGAIAYLRHVFRFGDRHVGYLDLETTFQALEASVR